MTPTRHNPEKNPPRDSSRPRKPLYVDSSVISGMESEGPALRLRPREGGPLHYPLRRLSRVVMRGAVDISGEALMAILLHGLPLSILDKDEKPAGVLLPARPLSPGDLCQRLEDLRELADLPAILENWRRARLRRAMLRHMAPHLGWLKDLRARSLRARAAAVIHRRDGLRWEKEARAFRPLLRAMAMRRLQRAGLCAAWMDPGPERPDLAALVAAVTEPALWGAALEKPLPRLRRWRDRIAFFESRHRLLEKETAEQAEALLRRLYSLPLVPGDGA